MFHEYCKNRTHRDVKLWNYKSIFIQDVDWDSLRLSPRHCFPLQSSLIDVHVWSPPLLKQLPSNCTLLICYRLFPARCSCSNPLWICYREMELLCMLILQCCQQQIHHKLGWQNIIQKICFLINFSVLHFTNANSVLLCLNRELLYRSSTASTLVVHLLQISMQFLILNSIWMHFIIQ